MYCYEPKYNIIWLNDKWTLNEGECKVNALWAHAECTVIANGVEWRAQGNPQWTHWERRWIHRIIGKWNISETVPFIWCIFNIHPQIHLCKSSVCNKLLLQIHNIFNDNLYLDDKKKGNWGLDLERHQVHCKETVIIIYKFCVHIIDVCMEFLILWPLFLSSGISVYITTVKNTLHKIHCYL